MGLSRIPTDANLFALPADLPAPEDDGAARHLPGMIVPHIRLRSTRGRTVDAAHVANHLSVFFFYPATVKPGIPIPGEWSEIPGARGCTLQSCAFRDEYSQFRSLNCEVFGVSGQGQGVRQGLAEQVEFATRVHLPFELLNDSRFNLVRALGIPTFVASLKSPIVHFEGEESTFPLQGRTLVKRLTFVADGGRIEKVFYPVFPPDRNASSVLAYLRDRDRT
ncbi:MAG TPA: peroxiredoxin [Planctomycetota bacterium]|nr:peroxiredoxin [Planctomycetota bacterium]